MIFFDYEVFKYDWMVVMADTSKGKFTEIVNDPEQLRCYFEPHKNELWCGYNSRGYDEFIQKGILLGMDPYDISQYIVVKHRKGWEYSGAFRQIKFACFDAMTNKFRGLKQLEGFMGHLIKESDVSFDLDRPLTEEEIKEVLMYCRHDVEELIQVFLRRQNEFESSMSMITEFKLPLHYINKTPTQLGAIVTGARKPSMPRNDEWDIKLPKHIQLGKYQHIADWYLKEENHNYDKYQTEMVAGIKTNFGWGGCHGALDYHIDEGIILAADVASMYAALQIEWDLLSRNVTNREGFRKLRDDRLRMKAEGNPGHKARKVAIVSAFGGAKDKYSQLYDPLMGSMTCIWGQLFLLDLIEKLEPYVKFLQYNTDGVYFKVPDEKTADMVQELTKEWESRMRFELEWDRWTNIWQRDVNNYILFNKDNHAKGMKEKTWLKRKGGWTKQLNDLDYDLAVINKALVDYFVHNTPPEDTIENCTSLRDFQQISKIGSPFGYGAIGKVEYKKVKSRDEAGKLVIKHKYDAEASDISIFKERVIRTFASSDPNDHGVWKFKVKFIDETDEEEHAPHKIGNTPDHCRIVNEDVNNMEIPDWLDKQWYVNLAWSRIKDFTGEGRKPR